MKRLGQFRTAADKAHYASVYETALAAAPSPPETAELITSFGTVHANIWWGVADHTPVFLLPGRSSGSPMWIGNLADFITTGRTIVAVDALGDAGLSVQTAPLRSPPDQGQWVEEALVELGWPRVHSVGHSFGGAIAAHHALRHPDHLASLALLEPVFTFAWPPPATFFWATVATLPLPRRWHEQALAAIGGVPVQAVREPSAIGDLITLAARTFTAALPTPRPLSDRQIAEVSIPTYVAIAGGSSLAGGREAAARARRLLQQGTVEVWDDTTHSLPMQKHQEVGERLARFWGDVDQQ